MSIVEKAVSRMDSGPAKKRGLAPRKTGKADITRQQDAVAKSGRTCSILNLDLEAMGSDPALVKQFRFLKRPVLARLFGRSGTGAAEGKLMMLTSDLPQVGKSFIALNMAASIAQEQMTKVLLIDADPIRRTLTQQLGLENEPGILDLLADPELVPEDVIVATDLPGLNFIPAGKPCVNATELFASKRMSEILTERKDPDLVILFDTPPLVATSEARALAERVSHTMIVVEAGRSQSAEIENMLETLGQTDSTVGLILNKAPRVDSSRYKDYYPY